MSRYLSRIALCLLTLSCLVVAAGCNRRSQWIHPPKMNASAAAVEAMAAYDTNQDGKISGPELVKCPALKEIAKDGAVTADAIRAIVEQWTKGPVGRARVGIAVLRNGKPLAGAIVTMEPEKFLGTEIKTITGTTAANGGALLTVPTSDPSEPKGLPLGFYRVEITKDGESIPAKYNADTTLGLAVCGEVTASFNLVY